MNYKENYYNYINYVRTLNRKKLKKEHPNYVYYEAHHVIPRSIIPELADLQENIVLLTAREHFLAHYLLTKMFSTGIEHMKMVYAFMSFQRGRSAVVRNVGGIVYINSKLWAKTREEFAIYVGISKTGNNKSHQMAGESHWNKGRKYSDKSKKLMSEKAKGRPSHMKGKHHTDETLEKLRKASTGRPQSVETRKKRSSSLKGKTKGRKASAETRVKQSEIAKRRWDKKPHWFMCVETGVTFNSLRSAMIYCGRSYMKRSYIDDPTKSVAGFHFVTI